MPTNNTLEIRNLDFFYKGRCSELKVISNLNLEFFSNSISVIIGPSGCGKSTLLNLIANVLIPENGSIVYSENGQTKKPKVGYVFQNPSLIPWRTVKENVLLGVEILENQTEETERIADDFLSAYGLGEFADSFPSILSGGMQQRVSIIRAVMAGVNILLLDEPFSNSDFVLRRELQEDLLKIVTKQNLIAIMVSHDLIEAVKIADQIIILSNRPATVRENFKIDINRNERMNTELLLKDELYRYIENINHVLIGQNFAQKMEGGN